MTTYDLTESSELPNINAIANCGHFLEEIIHVAGRGGLSICMRIYAEVEKKLGNKEKRQEIFLAAGSSHFYIMGPKYVWSHIIIVLPNPNPNPARRASAAAKLP